MINKLREHPFLLVGTIISLVTGIFLLISDPALIITFIYFVVGGGIILAGIYKIVISEIKDKMYFYNGVSDVVVGICYMFFHNIIVTIILGLIFVAFPVIRIIKSRNRYLGFKKELPLLIFGSVIAISGDIMGLIYVKILGASFILLAIYLFINIFTDKFSIFRLSFKRNRYDYDEDYYGGGRDDIIDVEDDDRD